MPLATQRRHKTSLGPAGAPVAQIVATKDYGFDLHVLAGGAAQVAPAVFTAGFTEPTGQPGVWRELPAGKQYALHQGDHLRAAGCEYVCELPAARVQPQPCSPPPAAAPGAQAQGLVRACECDGERAYLAAPTRSTGHRLAIRWSSPDAAGRYRSGFARRSGTALSGPCLTGV